MNKTFKDFIYLYEAITIKSTQYGTNINANNNKFIYINDDPSILGTCFKENNIYYLVSVDFHNNCEISFGAASEYSLDYNDYTMSRVDTKNPLSVISKVIYIGLVIVIKSKRNMFCFVGSDPGLVRLYNKLVDNQYFLDSINEYGFKYIGLISQYHTFKTI